MMVKLLDNRNIGISLSYYLYTTLNNIIGIYIYIYNDMCLFVFLFVGTGQPT